MYTQRHRFSNELTADIRRKSPLYGLTSG